MDFRKLLERAGLEAKGSPQALYGGDISRVYRLGDYVVKTAPNPPIGLFPAEARGLRALAERGVRVPRVFLAAEEGLVLEYLPEGPPDWEGLARMLAGLHRQREALYWAEAGFLGTFALPGGEGRDWTEFFFLRCIEPLLQATWDRLEGLGPGVEALFQKPLPA
ncbi:MAG: fructosamine kinase family protein, partial [Thermus sp.]